MWKWILFLLILCLFINPVSAGTVEVETKNFWQQFDIVFWQTFPFATFWCYVIGLQFGPVNWNNVLMVSTLASTVNAYFYAREAVRQKP